MAGRNKRKQSTGSDAGDQVNSNKRNKAFHVRANKRPNSTYTQSNSQNQSLSQSSSSSKKPYIQLTLDNNAGLIRKRKCSESEDSNNNDGNATMPKRDNVEDNTQNEIKETQCFQINLNKRHTGTALLMQEINNVLTRVRKHSLHLYRNLVCARVE